MDIRLGPATLNLTLYEGDSSRLLVILPLDLTGYLVSMEIRRRGGDLIVRLDSSNGGLIVQPNTGRDSNGALVPMPGKSVVRLRNLSTLEEQAISAGIAFYDLEVRQGSTVKTYLRGILKIEEDITA